MATPIMPGAEPISFAEGPRGGVLLLHGYTGTPQQIRPWAEAFAQAGFAVEAPLLPGHGTSPEDMLDTRWSDYLACAETFYQKLVERYQRVFVGGLCSGGNIATWLALQHPTTTAGVMVVNGQFKAPRRGSVFLLRTLLKTGRQFYTWSTLPKQVEDPQAPPVLAYMKVPFAPMVSLEPARIELCQRLNEVHCPTLVFTSLFGSAEAKPDKEPDVTWFEKIAGPVEHILLERSNHVATLDYDKEIIAERSIAFALTITKDEQEQASRDVA